MHLYLRNLYNGGQWLNERFHTMSEITPTEIDVELADLTHDVQSSGAAQVVLACGWTTCFVVNQ